MWKRFTKRFTRDSRTYEQDGKIYEPISPDSWTASDVIGSSYSGTVNMKVGDKFEPINVTSCKVDWMGNWEITIGDSPKKMKVKLYHEVTSGGRTRKNRRGRGRKSRKQRRTRRR